MDEETFAPLAPSQPIVFDEQAEEGRYRIVQPVPDNCVLPAARGVRNLYRDTAGRLLFLVDRIELGNGNKTYAPHSAWSDDNDHVMWRNMAAPAPRALYRLEHVDESGPASTVLVVEGEKTADAAAKLFPKLWVTTSSGGSGAAAKSDWGLLRNKKVVIWPDHDEPGSRYAANVSRLALEAGATSVAVVQVPSCWPAKWDLADDLPDGVSINDIRRLVEEAAPYTCGDIEAVDELESSPDLSILDDFHAAPPFDLSSMGPLEPLASELAKAKGAPVDYVTLSLLTAAAGCIGATRAVSPHAGWTEPAILWTVNVGSPSAGKSPAMDAVLSPLRALEAELSSSWPEVIKEYRIAAAKAKAKEAHWLEKVSKSDDATFSEMPADAAEPPKPQRPRISVMDTTVEACAAVIADNPRGVLLVRDEGSGWLANMDKYGRGDRQTWIEAWGGRATTIDRKKNEEPILIPHFAISVLIGIQPDRLRTCLATGDDDGFFSRCLFAFPSPVPPFRFRGHYEIGQVLQTLRTLRKLEFDQFGQPITLTLAPAASEQFETWRIKHLTEIRCRSELLGSALAKMPGQVLRLALVFELLHWAASMSALEPRTVSQASIGSAINLADQYFVPMLYRILGEIVLEPSERDARALAREILRRRPAFINKREVVRTWRLGLSRAQIGKAIEVLVAAKWLTDAAKRSGPSRGRKRGDYEVHERVLALCPSS